MSKDWVRYNCQYYRKVVDINIGRTIAYAPDTSMAEFLFSRHAFAFNKLRYTDDKSFLANLVASVPKPTPLQGLFLLKHVVLYIMSE